ncbi:MAG: lipase family protein [Pseudomonadota bacterium]
MIIKIGPSYEIARPPSAPTLTASAPLEEPEGTLAFSRQIKFGHHSEIDETGIALVDLSVLVYSPLDILQRVFSELGVEPVAFDAYCDRYPDFVWLERQAHARTIANALGIERTAGKRLSPLIIYSGLDGELARARALVDGAITSDSSASEDDESLYLQLRRKELASLLDNYRITSASTDVDIAADRRNLPPRVLAFSRDSNVYITFRGSATRLDWKRNLMFWPAGGFPWRHKGFTVCWQEVQGHLENWLAKRTRELGHKPTVHLSGHSLGGAIATLAAADLSAAGYPVGRVVTIGSPCVGGWGFRQRYRKSAAAPAAGGSRKLFEVTTRFVHGTDAVTFTPGLHVANKESLKAKDALNIEDFIGQGLFDTSALLALIGLPNIVYETNHVGGLANTVPAGKVRLLRNATTQILAWLAMYFPAITWMRVLPTLPILFEQTRTSFGQHRSARYWEFLPPTILRSAYSRILRQSATTASTDNPLVAE